jgi:1-deoxy-D-xylulose-5-phosphate synthase
VNPSLGDSPHAPSGFPPRTTPLLDSLGDEGTSGMKRMSVPELKDLAEEVRWQVLDAVSVTGGHLGAGLGVCDLTVALHHVYDTPRDEICWDVAHQCQPHKVLTGRRSRIYSLRQGGGLSGFAKRSESKYDAFGAGHSTTSISAAVGFETARNRQGKKGHSIAVIGDGAITGGMAWEAINHAGGMGSKVVVILNDNGQVSLPTFYNQVNQPVGALSDTLAQTSVTGISIQDNIAKVETSQGFQSARQALKAASKAVLPGQLQAAAAN